MGAGYMGPGFGFRNTGPTVGSPEDFANDYEPEDVGGDVDATPRGTIGTNLPYQLVSRAVKVATPETYELYPTSLSAVAGAQMFLELLGGNELIEISRHDLINGYGIKNQPIKDAQIIATQFNAFNIIPLQDTLPNYLDNFPIKLEEKLPSPETRDRKISITTFEIDAGKTTVTTETNNNYQVGDSIMFENFTNTSYNGLRVVQEVISATSFVIPYIADPVLNGFETAKRAIPLNNNVTIDDNGIITIELVNLRPDEFVEVEILYQGQILSDTKYTGGTS